MRYRARLSIAILTTGFIGMIILAAAPVFAQTQQQQRQQQKSSKKASRGRCQEGWRRRDGGRRQSRRGEKGLAKLNKSVKAAQQEVDEATKARRRWRMKSSTANRPIPISARSAMSSGRRTRSIRTPASRCWSPTITRTGWPRPASRTSRRPRCWP